MSEKREFNGRMMVRIPPYLHEKLAKAAESQGVSVNALVQSCLAEAIGRLAVEKRVKKAEKLP